MIEVKLEVKGSKELQAYFVEMPEKLRKRLALTISDLVIQLEDRVKDKLKNKVLHIRSGDLRRSIQHQVTITSKSVVGEVFSAGDVKYAAIHEYGGTIKTRLGTGKGKPKINGKATVNMPERSYMRSSLKEFKDKIESRISIAVKEATK